MVQHIAEAMDLLILRALMTSYPTRARSRQNEESVLERGGVRPRQVRYQAALRPDCKSFTDSKSLRRTSPPPTLVPLYLHFRTSLVH